MSVVEVFRKADLSDLPHYTDLPDDERRFLWILWIGKHRLNVQRMNPDEIRSVIYEKFDSLVPHDSVIVSLAPLVEITPPPVMWTGIAYEILHPGTKIVEDWTSRPAGKGEIDVFDPAKPSKTLKAVDHIFAGLVGTVRICDPYSSPATLDFFGKCQGATEFRLLTKAIADGGELDRRRTAIAKEKGIQFHIRKATAGQKLHDRWVTDDQAGWIFGSSLQTIENKVSVVIPVLDARQALVKTFDKLWTPATVFP